MLSFIYTLSGVHFATSAEVEQYQGLTSIMYLGFMKLQHWLREDEAASISSKSVTNLSISFFKLHKSMTK